MERSVLFGTAAVAVLAGCGGDSRPVTLEVRTDLPEALRDYVEESFEAVHLDTDVRFTVESTEASLSDLQSPRVDGQPPFDVWWGADVAGLEVAADADLLVPYRPVWIGEPSLVESSDDDAWQALLVTPFVIAFSRDDLQLNRAPSDWNDLRHFRWVDDIEVLDPIRSTAGAWMVTSLLARYERESDLDMGFDWLAALDGQVEAYATSSDDALRALESGRSRLALIPRADAEATRFDGASWLHYRLPESGTPVLARGVAVIAGVEHRARAEALVDHLGSLDVRTMAKLETRWQPAYGDADAIRVPVGFELEQSWRPYELAADHIERERAGWLDRWERHVRGR